eukprot:764413-Hanusia_phi.AAC.4
MIDRAPRYQQSLSFPCMTSPGPIPPWKSEGSPAHISDGRRHEQTSSCPVQPASDEGDGGNKGSTKLVPCSSQALTIFLISSPCSLQRCTHPTPAMPPITALIPAHCSP